MCLCDNVFLLNNCFRLKLYFGLNVVTKILIERSRILRIGRNCDCIEFKL